MIKENVSLKSYNSWSVGGKADYFSKPSNIKELREALQWAKLRAQKVSFLGSGSNVLISDEGIQGLVILLDQLRGIDVEEKRDQLQISAWAGAMKSDLFKIFLKYKLSPSIFLVGLPGSIGGGVVMNAGVNLKNLKVKTPRLKKKMPYQFSDIVSWVDVLTYENHNNKKELSESNLKSNFSEKFSENNSNKKKPSNNSLNKDKKPHLEASFSLKRIKASKLKWLYRKSLGWQPDVIVRVGFSWPKKEIRAQEKDKEKLEDKKSFILEQIKEQAKKRTRTQPLQKLSCGSVFKNPKLHLSKLSPKKYDLKHDCSNINDLNHLKHDQKLHLKLHPKKPLHSGELIEKSGLKGFSIGDAEVSTKHANFIINRGNAKARDIHHLICYVREKVKKKMGVSLETEVIYLGRWSK